jgi:hypothetical protein
MVPDQRTLTALTRRTGWRLGTVLLAAFIEVGGIRAQVIGPIAVAVAPDGIPNERPASLPATSASSTKERPATGNPLWAIPITALTQTGARPIFSPSRRPPSPPVVAAAPPPAPKLPPPREPDDPKLQLLGTVIGESDGIGVFMDEISKDVIRLRAGESHRGWTLRSLHPRAASFEKDRQEATLRLPTPGAETPAASVAAVPARTGTPGVCGPEHGAGAAADNCARPALPLVPVSAATTGSTRKIRQDILSIPVTN